jgi:mannosylglycerate hydrolase MGH1-like protein
MNDIGGRGISLWDTADGFYYDVLRVPGAAPSPLRVRSMVGLIPLFAVETLDSELIDRMPGFKRRMQWFIDNLPEFSEYIETETTPTSIRRTLSLVSRQRLRRVLELMLDETEFLSPNGIRSLSRFHREHPYHLTMNGVVHSVTYDPADSRTTLFGGNSNWRGPVWFPMNYLLIESLQKFHHYLGEDYKVECPTRSGKTMTLWEVAAEISRRLSRLCLQDENGRRPSNGANDWFHSDPHWRDLVLFYEYFHPETGQGLGANHQTGWTGLIAKLLQQSGE